MSKVTLLPLMVDSAMADQSAFEKYLRIQPLAAPVTSVGRAVRNLFNKWTGNGLTDAQMIQNQINIAEAQKTRDWQEELANTQYQRGVVDMQKAGINPALAMTSGASAAPTPSGATASAASQDNGVGFGELVNAVMLPLQIKQLQANIENVQADTAVKNVEAEGKRLQNAYQNLVNQYYPELTQETINKIHADVGVSLSDSSLKNAQTELAKVDKMIRQAQADKASDIVAAQIELQKAQSESALKAAIASAAKATVDRYEAEYMRTHNAKMSSNAIVALAEAIASWLPGDSVGVGDVVEELESYVEEKHLTPLKEYADGYSLGDAWDDFIHPDFKEAREFRQYEVQQMRDSFQRRMKKIRQRWDSWTGRNVK